jgi:hypothetical protein
MTKRLTDDQLREWYASLDGVTRGPWAWYEPSYGTLILAESGERTRREILELYRGSDTLPQDRAHFARCDPQTIGGLIEELQEWRKLFYANCQRDRRRIRNAALDEAAKVAQKHLVHPTGEMIAGAILTLKTPEESK